MSITQSLMSKPKSLKPPAWLGMGGAQSLASLCDTFLPSLPPEKITDDVIYSNLAKVVPNIPKNNSGKPWVDESSEVREFLMRGASDVDISSKAIKKIDTFVPPSDQKKIDETTKTNPNAKAMKYDPYAARGKVSLNPAPNTPVMKQKCSLPYVLSKCGKPEAEIYSTQPSEVNFDVVVIGSGTGGGTIAAELAKAGVKTLVLEKGGYYDSADFKVWKESEAMESTFERSGLLSSADGGIAVLAGACVGGGSTINWSASFRTPEKVLKEWEEDMKMPIFRKGGEFDASLDAVHELWHVNTANSYRPRDENGVTPPGPFEVNLNNQLLFESATKLGYEPEYIARNVKNCVDCGHCNHGCSYDAKQSTITNLMQCHIEQDQLSLIPNCHADKIRFGKGKNGRKKAVGVECSVDVPASEGHLAYRKQLFVQAKIVICAAGSIHTPAVLLRSKLSNQAIGKYLTLHPVVAAVGLFPEQNTGLNRGVSMGVVVKKKKTGPPGPAVAVETPPLHVGTLGLVLTWTNGLSYKLSSLMYQNLGVFLNIHRDESVDKNRVTIDEDGYPVVNYVTTKADKSKLLEIIRVMYDMIYVAKPTALLSLFEAIPSQYLTKPTTNPIDDPDYQSFMHSIEHEGIVENSVGLFSAHQMSSCRMHSNPKLGPTSLSGELYECEGLYIADGSLCPTSLGVNPMITIAAFAHYVSRNVLKSLGVKPFTHDF